MSQSSSKKPKTPNKQSAAQQGQSQVVAQTDYYSGPIPLPAVLHGYEQIVPGAAERIILMAEQQAQHRRELEKQSQEADIAARNRVIEAQQKRDEGVVHNERIGQGIGGVIALACVAISGWGLVHGASPIAIGLFMSLPVAGIIRAHFWLVGSINRYHSLLF